MNFLKWKVQFFFASFPSTVLTLRNGLLFKHQLFKKQKLLFIILKSVLKILLSPFHPFKKQFYSPIVFDDNCSSR